MRVFRPCVPVAASSLRSFPCEILSPPSMSYRALLSPSLVARQRVTRVSSDSISPVPQQPSVMDSQSRRLRQALHLGDEGVTDLLIADGLWNSESRGYQLCLIGRLLSRQPFSFGGQCASVKGMIVPVKGMEIKQLPGGRLLIRFNHVIDRNRALERCPWSFERMLDTERHRGTGEPHARRPQLV
ncbi:hypothetical protein Salat_1113400 [Sesamum alatum]|uniref:DUF4283 domain-containing protein n=1 Tax=Sesamum alatum TaxID=300844 RepID=A0AAE1YNH8_9LAMI|nr:hypothetical protein Salat_1113400 [Sesamum alatum]